MCQGQVISHTYVTIQACVHQAAIFNEPACRTRAFPHLDRLTQRLIQRNKRLFWSALTLRILRSTEITHMNLLVA